MKVTILVHERWWKNKMDKTSIIDMQKEVLIVIKELRQDRGYSLADVAKGIGYKTLKGYYDLESGKTDIKLEHLIKLTSFYCIPISFFFKEIVPIWNYHPSNETCNTVNSGKMSA